MLPYTTHVQHVSISDNFIHDELTGLNHETKP